MKVTGLVVALAALAGGSAAAASPLSEALAKKDIAALRAQLPDPAARCALGAAFAAKSDLSRAALYLEGCGDIELPPEISADVARANRDVTRKLRESDLTRLEIVTRPASLAAETDALPGESLTTPATIWVKAGTYTVHATAQGKPFMQTVTVAPFTRSTVYMDLEAQLAPASPARDGRVDFGEDNALEKTDGPPPDVKRGSMINNKLLGVTGPRTGDEIADPLATGPARSATPLPMWLGVRLGGGVFDDGATSARMRPSVAAAARFLLTDRLFVAARLDYTRRGGAASSSVDVLGASAGAGYSVLDTPALGIALIGQLRADLRFTDTREMSSVNRAGASAAASLEVAFPSTPLTAGVRFEQGLTELVPGAHDRALLLELGVDWR